jgi:hypothetical protein
MRFSSYAHKDTTECFERRWHCIRDVDAIPGYQEIHAMYGCYGNVRSVGGRQ